MATEEAVSGGDQQGSSSSAPDPEMPFCDPIEISGSTREEIEKIVRDLILGNALLEENINGLLKEVEQLDNEVEKKKEAVGYLESSNPQLATEWRALREQHEVLQQTSANLQRLEELHTLYGKLPSLDDRKVTKEIRKSNPELILVHFTNPKQTGFLCTRDNGSYEVLPYFHESPQFLFEKKSRIVKIGGKSQCIFGLRSSKTKRYLSRSMFSLDVSSSQTMGQQESIHVGPDGVWRMYQKFYRNSHPFFLNPKDQRTLCVGKSDVTLHFSLCPVRLLEGLLVNANRLKVERVPLFSRPLDADERDKDKKPRSNKLRRAQSQRLTGQALDPLRRAMNDDKHALTKRTSILPKGSISPLRPRRSSVDKNDALPEDERDSLTLPEDTVTSEEKNVAKSGSGVFRGRAKPADVADIEVYRSKGAVGFMAFSAAQPSPSTSRAHPSADQPSQ